MESTFKKKKVGEIELFRFFFAVMIMLMHSKTFMGGIAATPFPGGAFGVEFFFIVSGYLLMASVDKIRSPLVALGGETVGFLWKKVKVFYPEMLVSTAAALVVTSVTRDYTLRQSISSVIDIVWEILLVSQSGLTTGEINGADWYLSAMLLCTAIIYPVLRKNKEMGAKVVLPLIMLFLFGNLCQTYNGLRGPGKWHYFFMKGVLRGFAEMCLGIVTYQIVEKIKNINFNRFGAVALSVIRWGCYFCIIRYTLSAEWNDRDIFYCLLFAVAIGIGFSRKAIDSKIFDNKLCYFLGEYSLLIYLNNIYWRNAIARMESLMNLPPIERLLCYVIIVFASSAMIMGICKLLRRSRGIIETAVKSVFLAD